MTRESVWEVQIPTSSSKLCTIGGRQPEIPGLVPATASPIWPCLLGEVWAFAAFPGHVGLPSTQARKCTCGVLLRRRPKFRWNYRYNQMSLVPYHCLFQSYSFEYVSVWPIMLACNIQNHSPDSHRLDCYVNNISKSDYIQHEVVFVLAFMAKEELCQPWSCPPRLYTVYRLEAEGIKPPHRSP